MNGENRDVTRNAVDVADPNSNSLNDNGYIIVESDLFLMQIQFTNSVGQLADLLWGEGLRP